MRFLLERTCKVTPFLQCLYWHQEVQAASPALIPGLGCAWEEHLEQHTEAGGAPQNASHAPLA